MAPGLGGSGSFQRQSRLADNPRPSRKKPLEKTQEEKYWLSRLPPGSSGARLGSAGYGPKPPSLPVNFIYAKAAAIGDVITAEGDEHDVIGRVLGHRKDGVVVCLDVATGKRFGVGPDVIVELGVGS